MDQNLCCSNILENSPLRRCGIPQANSTTSKPLVTEPFASARVLPCSFDTISANSLILFSIKFLYFDNILDLFSGVVEDQPS